MSLTLSPTLLLKVPPPVVSERQEQKLPPTNSRPVRSQASQDPVPPVHATRQPRSSGSQTKGRAPELDSPTVSQLKNAPTPVSTPLQPVISCSMAISAITKDDIEPGHTQDISPSPSTSGTSPRKGGRSQNKTVRCVYHFACIDVLTRHYRSRHRRRRTQQLKRLRRRKACHRSKTLSKNPLLCNVTR